VNPNDVPKAKRWWVSSLFNAKKNYSIVLPESMVVSAEAYTSKRERSNKYRKGQQKAGEPPYPQDPIALTWEFKLTQSDLIEQQKQALKQFEEQKKTKKLSREVKQALGESITAAEQRRVLDAIQSYKQGESDGKQESPDPSTVGVGRRDMRRQRSLQPHVYDMIPCGAGKDSASIHRRLGNQGKSSSIAQAEGCGESFQMETPTFHAGHQGGHGDPRDHGGHGDPRGHGGHRDPRGHGGHADPRGLGGHGTRPPYDWQRQPAYGRAIVHENLHESNQYRGDPPSQQQQYGDNCYHSEQALIRNP
jgi:hypothetical protein